MAIERKGYQDDFLGNGYKIELPEISLEQQNEILRKEIFRNEFIVDYVHYSVAMNKKNRQAFFSAANIDQTKFQSGIEDRDWFVDPRVEEDFQIGPDAYYNNYWDRGHLTRRADIAWGEKQEAKKASIDSCSYTNASPQHENFNQDEWTVPEAVIYHFDRDLNDKLIVFTGPVFTNMDRWYNKSGLKFPVRIPSAFWKMVVYIDKNTKNIGCQAYVMYQDDLFIADKRGSKKINISSYQVTVTEIESLTGLMFDRQLFDSNPLYYYPRAGINNGPEAVIPPKRRRNIINLDEGVIFERSDMDNEKFKNRKKVLNILSIVNART